VNVSYLNPFIRGCVDVLGQTLKMEVSLGRPRLAGFNQRYLATAVAVCHEVKGKAHGMVQLRLPQLAALRIASRLSSEPVVALTPAAESLLFELAELIGATATQHLRGQGVYVCQPWLLPPAELTSTLQPNALVLPMGSSAGRLFLVACDLSTCAKLTAPQVDPAGMAH
jgi:CheY-specific phosphatase CheX